MRVLVLPRGFSADRADLEIVGGRRGGTRCGAERAGEGQREISETR